MYNSGSKHTEKTSDNINNNNNYILLLFLTPASPFSKNTGETTRVGELSRLGR